METGLKDHVALITGGSIGIGLGLARSLAKEGVHLAIASRHPREEGIKELRGYGVDVLPITADVGREDQVIGMVSETISHFGHLDYYINNAARTWHEPVTRLTTEAWLTTINTNLSSCVWACREVSRHMIDRKQGSILIVGSTASFHPLYKEASYRVTKTGLLVYMEVLAIEMAPYNIRVNMIVPGPFDTDMARDVFSGLDRKTYQDVPLGRIGQSDECGPAAVLLLSDQLSSYTTACILVIDGGLRLRPHKLYTDDELRAMNS